MPKNILIALFVAISTFILASCSTPSQLYQQISQPEWSNQATSTTRARLGDQAFWQGNPHTIWDRLQHTPLQKLEMASVNPDAAQAAWIKLAIISKRYNSDSKQLVQQLIIWRNENPDHPGNQLFNNNGTLTTLNNTYPPKHIALLLPLQGQMASSGQAVRDGFISAYYSSLAKTHIQQTISFYDTSTNQNPAALYQQAIGKGADVVIGPLMKEDVQKLSNSSDISVPTLALNYTEGSLPNNLYEFGLSPADEAEQIANKAWRSGHSNAIVIAPQNTWGQRVSKNLISHWQSLGGKVSDTFYYSKRAEFNQSIAVLLHINPKEDRKKVREGNNKTILEQQRRQDFDVIFLLAEPQAGREIVPLLKYYYAEHIPIYATSMIYSGSPNPQKDTDLNGVIFADIPWILKASHNTSRLYAVGRDAYIISGELQRLKSLPNFPIYAATGALTLTPTHQIYRRLPMAQIRNGHP